MSASKHLSRNKRRFDKLRANFKTHSSRLKMDLFVETRSREIPFRRRRWRRQGHNQQLRHRKGTIPDSKRDDYTSFGTELLPLVARFHISFYAFLDPGRVLPSAYPQTGVSLNRTEGQFIACIKCKNSAMKATASKMHAQTQLYLDERGRGRCLAMGYVISDAFGCTRTRFVFLNISRKN
jgi:hypothetical protein